MPRALRPAGQKRPGEAFLGRGLANPFGRTEKIALQCSLQGDFSVRPGSLSRALKHLTGRSTRGTQSAGMGCSGSITPRAVPYGVLLFLVCTDFMGQ